MPPPYHQVQFIGFQINTLPADKLIGPNNPFGKEYLGHADDRIDIAKRCQIMINAVRVAEKSGNIAPGALKIFVAPEFFFRGSKGAYPIEQVSTILPKLRQWTHSGAFADWMFVFGSALGYFNDGQAKEIFNISLVQRGGTNSSDKDDARLVYKEYISPVDFIRATGSTPFTCPNCGFNTWAGGAKTNWDLNRADFRLALVGNPSQRMSVLRPTQGSRDHLSRSTNAVGRGKEDSASGLGGGGMFDMMGVRFGLEVCLDHAKERLRNSPPAAGQNYPQIHLIPSCGMNINDNAIACGSNGLVFNVDGWGGTAHTDLIRNTGTYDVPARTYLAWNHPGNSANWAGLHAGMALPDHGTYFSERGWILISAPQAIPAAVPAPP